MDEQELIQNPEALLALMQQAVQHLIEQRPDTAAQEAQLREVSRTVERLEKIGLSVPEELRRLKTNLVVQTDQDTDFDRQLRTLGESLAEALGMIESVISKPRLEGSIQKESTPRPLPRNNARLVSSPLKGHQLQAQA